VAALAACGVVRPRFPAEVHAALADQDMRRLETRWLILYYPAARRDQALRFADRAEGCVTELKARSRVRNRFWREKVIVVMPEVAFNNAFVVPPTLGVEAIALVPTFNTLDFVTEFGLPPDPAHIACHEIAQYAQHQQVAGVWGFLDRIFGDVISPQIGFDPWFVEGLATHYEASLQPGAGRPRWPIFRGMFHAGYANERIGGGDLSELGRRAPPGHDYLVGTFFIEFLVEHYGETALWRVIEAQSHAALLVAGMNGRFEAIYGKSLAGLIDEFATWTAERFPPRPTPADQRRVRGLGSDARYARGPGGHEAVVSNDSDGPTQLTVWGPDGRQHASLPLVDLIPPRKLVIAAPILTSGLGVTADGTVYLTAVDLGTTQQTTRLLRWNGALSEVVTGLGPGAAVDPAGRTYYYLAVDGDRWQLAAYDLATRTRRIVTPTAAGQYVSGAQVSPDGRRLIASVWDGAFVLWVIDAASGTRLSEIRTADRSPVFDGAFVDDNTVTHLVVVDGRFQVAVRDLVTGASRVVTDAPYAVLQARPSARTVRFLNRQGWRWTIDEVALVRPLPPTLPPLPDLAALPAPVPLPSQAPPGAEAEPSRAPEGAPPPTEGASVARAGAGLRAAPASPPAAVLSDEPYSQLDHLVVPQLHTFALVSASSRGPLLLGAALAGGDRLGFHRWAVAGYVQPSTGQISGQVGYLNSNLAPWTLSLRASHLAWQETFRRIQEGAVPVHERQRTRRQASASLGRTWRGTLATAVDGVAVEDRERVLPSSDPDPPAPLAARRMAGAGLRVAYAAVERTRLTGLHRGWELTLGATHYPAALSSGDLALTDIRIGLGLHTPAPLGRRHSLSFAARGRSLLSARRTDLFQLGGAATLSVLWDDRWSDRAAPNVRDDNGLPTGIGFVEPLRGYEDFPIYTDAAAIADASWRYPLIIDRGIATTLWLLPASFLRQLDLELFGSAAFDDRGRGGLHGAFGGSLTLRFAFVRIPLVVSAQIARRLFDDDAIATLVGFNAEL